MSIYLPIYYSIVLYLYVIIRVYTKISYTIMRAAIITYATSGQQSCRLFGWIAVGVHGLQHVQAKREGDYGL